MKRPKANARITDVLIPRSIRPEHIQSLVDDIKLGKDDLDIEVRMPPRRGYGVTWWEVIIFYLGSKALDAIAGYPMQLLLDEIKEKVKRWYKQRRSETGNKRPLSLAVRDGEGRLLLALEMQATGEMKDVTKESGKSLQPPPGSTQDDESDSSEDAECDTARMNSASHEQSRITVIFCDIVGSSLLPPSKGTEFRGLLGEYRRLWREAIHRHSGIVIASRRDNVIAYFEETDEQSSCAERAALAALEIVDKSARFQAANHSSTEIKIRIGLATDHQAPADFVEAMSRSSRSTHNTSAYVAAGLSQLSKDAFIAVEPPNA